jgi:GGDEF domain-containing protein
LLVVPTGQLVDAEHAASELEVLERRVLERIEAHLVTANAQLAAQDMSYRLRLSIGTARATRCGTAGAGETLASLMATADERLYSVKRARRANVTA